MPKASRAGRGAKPAPADSATPLKRPRRERGTVSILPRPDPAPQVDVSGRPEPPPMYMEPAYDLEELAEMAPAAPKLWQQPYRGLPPDQLPWPEPGTPVSRPPAKRPKTY